MSQTLRCESESPLIPAGGKLGNFFRESEDGNWNTHGPEGMRIPRLTSGRVGACARDMVGECRRCGSVVCRNCIMKAPSAIALKARHRRLCRTCIKAPLDSHFRITPLDTENNHHSQTSHRQATRDPSPSLHTTLADICMLSSSSSQPLYRSPCTCSSHIWICSPCGTTLRTHDTSYTRAWTWRSRYSTSSTSPLGTGIGHGIEGVQCGRESSCLSSRTIYKEIECDATDTRTGGYFLQEMEGIGGVVKKKVKRRVEVGEVVREDVAEGEGERFLARELEGVDRSWCSWCARVVLSKKDAARFDGADGELLDTSLVESDVSSSSSL
ncbi:hypothetical protein E4T47_02541 [Aureobasidium subglaciale]|nr:hypothetical protein E4T47_02541 [Aureobasidium subglaciale]